VVSVAKPERSHFFSYLEGKSKEHSSKSLPLPDKKPKVDRLLRRRCELTANGAEKATRRSEYLPNQPRVWPHATDEAKEWDEVSVQD
jgi:hypothetical protein